LAFFAGSSTFTATDRKTHTTSGALALAEGFLASADTAFLSLAVRERLFI
jgi:hypothetical protein